MSERRVEQLRFASVWLRLEEEAGQRYGPELLSLPTGLWRSEMERDANLRRYGTLRFVLNELHQQLFHSPVQARERAAVVIEYAKRAEVPSRHYYAALAGHAWKTYANALRYAHELEPARRAARRSRRIFATVGSLACDAAKAHLVEALVYREQGDLDTVLTIARECAKVFRDHADAQAYMHARMTEVLVLTDTKRFKDAMVILAETAADAEYADDRHTLAICLHNLASCARAIGDLAAARRFDARALAHFEKLGTAVEKPRIRWTEALALADEGRTSAAVLQLYVARSEFLALGMNGDAAACGLDLARLRYDRGEDITAECTELVETLTRAGLIQSAIEALAYLREQARSGRVSSKKIEHVRAFVREAVTGQQRIFLPPPEDEGGI